MRAFFCWLYALHLVGCISRNSVCMIVTSEMDGRELEAYCVSHAWTSLAWPRETICPKELRQGVCCIRCTPSIYWVHFIAGTYVFGVFAFWSFQQLRFIVARGKKRSRVTRAFTAETTRPTRRRCHVLKLWSLPGPFRKVKENHRPIRRQLLKVWVEVKCR